MHYRVNEFFIGDLDDLAKNGADEDENDYFKRQCPICVDVQVTDRCDGCGFRREELDHIEHIAHKIGIAFGLDLSTVPPERMRRAVDAAARALDDAETQGMLTRDSLPEIAEAEKAPEF